MNCMITICILLQFAFSTTLSIRIRAAGTLPAPMAYVRLEKFGVVLEDGVVRDGRVEFSNLAGGRYTIVADAPGYETSYTEVSLPFDSFSTIELCAKKAP